VARLVPLSDKSTKLGDELITLLDISLTWHVLSRLPSYVKILCYNDRRRIGHNRRRVIAHSGLVRLIMKRATSG
jgi:hypothetical protein